MKRVDGASSVAHPLSAGMEARQQPDSSGNESELSEPEMGPTMVDVTLSLTEGRECRTKLSSDSEILRELFESLAAGPGAAPFANKLLQVPTDGGQTAFSLLSEQLVAITTSPPVLIEKPAEQKSLAVGGQLWRPSAPQPTPDTAPPTPSSPPVDDEGSGPELADDGPLRDFHPLPFVELIDFLGPDEHSQLLQSTLAAETRFAREPGAGNGELLNDLEPALAERIADRLRLLLPLVLRTFRPAHLIEVEDLEFHVHRHGDFLKAGSASAANPHEVTCAYIFHREPKRFSGGELCFHGEEAAHLIEPRNNSLMLYPTAALEEVLPLCCPTNAFSDSRFAVSVRIA